MNKIELIKQYKEPIIVAIDTYLKQVSELTCLAPMAEISEAQKVTSDLNLDSKEYEKIRDKLIKNDFNLSPFEISKIGLIMFYQEKVISKQILTLEKLKEQVAVIYRTIFES